MKKKNLFITLGLALGLGIGAAAGVGARQETKKASAAQQVIYLIDFGGYLGSTPNAYVYSPEGLGTWGGTAMTSVTYGVYKVTLPNEWYNYGGLIFNGNSKQTYDIKSNWDSEYATRNGFVITGVSGSDSGKVECSLVTFDLSNSGFYLHGSVDGGDNNWEVFGKMSVSSSTATFNGVELQNGGDVQVVYHYSSTGHLWSFGAASASAGDSHYPVTYGSNNAYVTYGNTYNVSVNLGTKAYTLTPTEFYKLTIGSTELTLYPSGDGFANTFTSVSANQSISLTLGGSTHSFTVNDWPSNNVTSNKKVKVNASSVQAWMSSENVLWLDGYKAPNDKLDDFSAKMVKYTISGGSCSNPATTTIVVDDAEYNSWVFFTNYFNSNDFGSSNRSAFATAVSNARYGTGLSYSSILDEAACRYATLMEKYPSLTPFSGVTPPSPNAAYVTINSQTENSSVVIITVIIAVTGAIAVGAYLLIKKKHEN